MKEWEPFIAMLAVAFFIVHSISDVGKSLGKRIDELHEKVEALQEKLDEIESELETEHINKNHINPVDE
jgi:prefoldin subunit 5